MSHLSRDNLGIKRPLAVLIVDDNPTNLSLLESFLQKAGDYNILSAESGEKALEISRNNSIDLVLLDIMMPDMDGYQVCSVLKQMPECADTSVIFLTAKHDIKSMVKGFDVGAVDYLTKPINFEELKVRVNTHLRLRRQEQELKLQDAEKNRFVSIVAEDLRNPIEGLKSVLKMLDDSSETLEKSLLQEYISLAYSAADSLDAISKNLTQWSELQNNELLANPQEIDVYNIFNEVIDKIQAENKQKDITINNEIEAGKMAYFDNEYLRIIASNILSNAVSFSHKGGKVDVSAGCSNINGSLTITVKDEGVGMTPDDQQGIFLPGKQHKKEGTAGEIGTGMGLVLCHDLLLNSNGSIWVESNLGRGTSVYINLPLKK